MQGRREGGRTGERGGGRERRKDGWRQRKKDGETKMEEGRMDKDIIWRSKGRRKKTKRKDTKEGTKDKRGEGS